MVFATSDGENQAKRQRSSTRVGAISVAVWHHPTLAFWSKSWRLSPKSCCTNAPRGTDCGPPAWRSAKPPVVKPHYAPGPVHSNRPHRRGLHRTRTRRTGGMPRDKGIGRKRKRSTVPLARKDQNIPAAAASEPDPEPEPERPEDVHKDWLAVLLFDIANQAADVQRTRNTRFLKYAAMTSACAQALRHCYDGRQEQHYDWAWCQANSELESCCVDPPYCSVSPKYRCESCGSAVCYCTCTVQCKCGVMLAKWSWRYGVFRFDVCMCRERRGRPAWDWARFDRRPPLSTEQPLE